MLKEKSNSLHELKFITSSVKIFETKINNPSISDSASSAITSSDFETSTPKNNKAIRLESKIGAQFQDFEGVHCSCTEHIGRQMLNKDYELSPNYIFECIFGDSEFCRGVREARGFSGAKIIINI